MDLTKIIKTEKIEIQVVPNSVNSNLMENQPYVDTKTSSTYIKIEESSTDCSHNNQSSSYEAPSQSGDNGNNPDPKRGRTQWAAEQLIKMEGEFKRNHYLSRAGKLPYVDTKTFPTYIKIEKSSTYCSHNNQSSSYEAPSQSGDNGNNPDLKRGRTQWAAEQLIKMEGEFKRNHCLSRAGKLPYVDTKTFPTYIKIEESSTDCSHNNQSSSYEAPSQSGGIGKNPDPKRRPTQWTSHQLMEMEREFKQNHYLSRAGKFPYLDTKTSPTYKKIEESSTDCSHNNQSSSYEAPSQSGGNGKNPDPKRGRSQWTSHQLMEMEREFKRNNYLARSGKHQLCKDLKLTERQVTVWFQNRRVKSRKEESKVGSAPKSSIPNSDCSSESSVDSSMMESSKMSYFQDDSTTSTITTVFPAFENHQPDWNYSYLTPASSNYEMYNCNLNTDLNFYDHLDLYTCPVFQDQFFKNIA